MTGYLRMLNITLHIPDCIINSIYQTCDLFFFYGKLQENGRWLIGTVASGTDQQTKSLIFQKGMFQYYLYLGINNIYT